MKGIREMKDLALMLVQLREKGMREVTGADLKELIVRAVRATGAISAVAAGIGIITDLATIAGAAREATRGRKINLSGARSQVKVSFRKPRLRMKSAEMKKREEIIRREKDFIYEEDEASVKNKNKAGRFIKPEKKPEEEAKEQIKVITVPESLTLKELADKMKMQPSAIIKKLFLQGQIVTVNSEISFE